MATGGGFASLGFITFIVGGAFWLVALSRAQQLDDECPHQTCVRGTEGADHLEDARAASNVGDVLVGVGTVATGGGLLMLIIGAVLPKTKAELAIAPMVSSDQAGLTLGAQF